MDADVLYRYEDHGDVVILEQYPVVKRTPCGAWINVCSKRRFILAGTFKKFACATEEDARVSFFARKARQLKILRARIAAVTGAVQALKENRISDSNVKFELDDY